jgi:hypothetical protein
MPSSRSAVAPVRTCGGLGQLQSSSAAASSASPPPLHETKRLLRDEQHVVVATRTRGPMRDASDHLPRDDGDVAAVVCRRRRAGHEVHVRGEPTRDASSITWATHESSTDRRSQPVTRGHVRGDRRWTNSGTPHIRGARREAHRDRIMARCSRASRFSAALRPAARERYEWRASGEAPDSACARREGRPLRDEVATAAAARARRPSSTGTATRSGRRPSEAVHRA